MNFIEALKRTKNGYLIKLGDKKLFYDSSGLNSEITIDDLLSNDWEEQKKEYVSTIEAFKALKIGKSVRPKRICDGSYYTYTFGKLNLISSNGIVDNSTCKTLYAEYIIDDLWEILD